MKTVLLACALSLGFTPLASAQALSVRDTSGAPRFEFKARYHDFGTLPEGAPAVHVFTFKNAGKAPLLIQNITASCGCTSVEVYPHVSGNTLQSKPILRGKTGRITVHYDTKTGVGPFEKIIYIQSNAPALPGEPPRFELKILGTVVKAATK